MKIRMLTSLAILLFASASFAQDPTFDVTLTWVQPTQNTDNSQLRDLASYKIYYGTSSRNYSSVISVPCQTPGTPAQCNVTGYVVSNQSLSPNTTYFFAATAVNALGQESAFSNEATKITPNTLPPGAPTGFDVVITINLGSN